MILALTFGHEARPIALIAAPSTGRVASAHGGHARSLQASMKQEAWAV